MTATVTHTLGKFVWRELFTPDVEAAKAFYGGVFGWSWNTMPMGDEGDYTLCVLGEKNVGGIMDLAHIPGEHGIPPHWSLYASVEDVDRAAAKAVELGGKQLNDCSDIPGVGRFASIQDPRGAMLNLFRASNGDGEDREPGVGEFCWEHLNTSDPAAAVPFYTEVVGWGTQAFGPMSFFTREAGTKPVAVVSQVPVGVQPHWLTYVKVDDLAATNDKVRALGGTVIEERITVPGKGSFALLQDPFGAFFMTSQPE